MRLSHAFPALSCAVALVVVPRVGEDQEPPVRYYIEHHGGTTDVLLDRPFELRTEGGEVFSATLRAHPTRVFAIDQLSFEYPRHLPFEFDDSGSVAMWTLDGNDVTVVVQRFEFDHLDPEQLLEDMAEAAVDGLAADAAAPISLDVRGAALPGKRVEATVAGHRLRQDWYLAAHADGAIVTFMIQDSPQAGGDPSDEAALVIGMIQRTLKRGG